MSAIQYDRDAISSALLSSLGTVYDCKRTWSAWSQGTMGPDDFVPFDMQDDRIEEVVDAVIAALPNPQAAKCDGNHGSPRCADPECWNDSPPAQQATPEPPGSMIGMGAQALGRDLGSAICRDESEPTPYDEAAGKFGPHVSAWLRKVATEYLSKAPAPNHCRGITDPGCGYLSTCGAICNKCGQAHRGGRPATPEPVGEPRGWAPPTEAEIDEYLEDYEMHGNDEDGRDACHTPTEGERILIKDAILGLLADTRPAPAAQAVPMTWPKARDVGRFGDMDPMDHIRVGLDSDNDVYVSVWGKDGGASVEFCNPGGGGGGSSRRTREALIALMVAMEADNAERPDKDWWARRTAQAEGGA